MSREASGARLNAVPDLAHEHPGADDYPWPAGPWVRALMVMTLDGAIAGSDGRSGSISGPADRSALAAVRRYCDAVVVGAQTMRVERYSPMRTRPEIAAARESRGLAPAPRLIVISASLDLPWSEPAYAESAQPPLIVTPSTSDVAARQRVPATCELLVAPGTVEPEWLLQQCRDRGLDHVVCEGGRRVLREFLEADAIDEWALTLSGRTAHASFHPVMVRSTDDFVFTRFLRGPAGEEEA